MQAFKTGRDKPVPYKARAGTLHALGTGHVGATLVVARADILHEFRTGRHKPVPYGARLEPAQALGDGTSPSPVRF